MGERRHAVLIGCSAFGTDSGFPPLKCPLRDVDGMRDILVSTGGFADPVVLKNEPHDKVRVTIERVFRQATADDLVLFYYSGHGKLDLKGRLYLATPDTVPDAPLMTSIAAQDIRDIIEDSDCTKAILIFDCCYSGKAAAGYKSAQVSAQLKALATEGRGTYILSAATGYELAKEPPEGEGAFSLFTGHFIDGIREGAQSDRDGNVTVPELSRYINDRMRIGPQRPMTSGFNLQGTMVIAHRESRVSPKLRRRARVFLSCDDAEEPVVRDMLKALASECDFFVDTKMPVGTIRAEWIGEKLRASDAMIIFVSAKSASSWKVNTELETARRLAETPAGGPVVIPVRLGALPPLTGPLADYLNPIQWATWKGPDDTVRLLSALREGIAAGKSARRSGNGRVRRPSQRRPRS